MADFITPNLEYTEPEDGGSVNTWGAKLNANIRKQDLDIHARFKRSGDTMSGPLGVVAGTAGAPGVFISGDADTGYYSPGPDMVGIATGGVGRFVLSNTLLSLAVGLMVSGSTALQAASATTLSTSGLATLASLSTSSATVTGGTINGVVIGGSTPAAGTFTALASTGNASVGGNLSVAGNLTVNGTTTTVNSTVTTLDDPVLTLGGDTAPTVDDNKDRGIEFRWHNGTAAKVGFFGFDDSTGYFGFIPDATNTSEVFSGTLGDFQATNFRGNLIGATATLSSDLTLNGGTANGVAYLNGSKVLTTGTALTFDGTNFGIGTASPGNKLHVVGSGDTARFTNGTRSAYLALDSAGFTLFSGAGQTGNGIYARESDNSLQLWTNGSAKFQVDSAGNAGLGLTPNAWNANFRALQMGSNGYGAFAVDNSNAFTEMVNNTYASGASTWKYIASLAATRYSQQLGKHVWQGASAGTGGNNITWSDVMTLTLGGNLLVGTPTDSNARLSIFGGALPTNNGLHFLCNASTSNGRLVTSQSDLAVINNYLDTATTELSAGTTSSAVSGIVIGAGSATVPNTIRMFTASIEAARITSARNFLVGTTTEGAGLAVNTKLAVQDALDAAIFRSESSTGGFPVRVWNTATTGNNLFAQFLTEGSATERGNIDYNRAGGLVRYNTTSDQTLKTLIGDAPQEKSLTILRETRLREYYWNDDPDQKPQITPFAQELHQTFPGAVSVGGWYDEVIPAVTEQILVSEGVQEVQDAEGNVLIPGQDPVYETVVIEPEHTVQKYRPWGVDKTAFSFHLVAGFQHHDQRIAELQARIEALEAA